MAFFSRHAQHQLAALIQSRNGAKAEIRKTDAKLATMDAAYRQRRGLVEQTRQVATQERQNELRVEEIRAIAEEVGQDLHTATANRDAEAAQAALDTGADPDYGEGGRAALVCESHV